MAEFFNPFIFGTGNATVLAILNDVGVDANGRADSWDAERHELKGLEATLAFAPGIVRQRHYANVHRSQIVDFCFRAPAHCFHVNSLQTILRRADHSQAKAFMLGQLLQSASQSIEVLDRTEAPGPTDNGRCDRFLRLNRILLSVDGSWNHGDARIELPRVLGEVRVPDHHV